jgi:hypothetical protein
MHDLRGEEALFPGKTDNFPFYIVVIPDKIFSGRRNTIGVVKVVGFVKCRVKTEAQPVAVFCKFRFVTIRELIEHKAAVLVAFEQIEQKFGLIFIMQFFQIGKIKVRKDRLRFAGSIVFEKEDGVINKKAVFFHNNRLPSRFYCNL